MNKRALAVLMTVALVAAQPMSAFAAKSPNSYPSNDESSKSHATTSTTTTTADGKSLTTNGAGSGTTNVKLEFAVGTAETAGLPTAVVSSIKSINSGAKLADAVGNADLNGYAALTVTSAVIAKNATTGTMTNEPTSVTLYIPNLVSGLQNVKILYYENASGLWKVLEPSAVNYDKKLVSFTVNGSGTVAVIHK